MTTCGRGLGLLRAIGLATVVIVVASASGCGRAPQKARAGDDKRAKELLQKVAAAYQRLHSFSEQTTMRTQTTGEAAPRVTQTRFLYREPNYIYYEAKDHNPLVRVCDGTRMILYAPRSNMYRQGEAPPNLGAFFGTVRFDAPGINELALLVGGEYEGVLTGLRWGKSEEIAGVTTQPISGEIAAIAGASGTRTDARQTLWIDTKTHMIRRNRVVVRGGNETMDWQETMVEVQINPDLPDERFKWSPPPGAKPAAPPVQPPGLPPQGP